MSAFHVQRLEKPDGRPLWLYARTPLAISGPAPVPAGERASPSPHLRWHPLRGEWIAYAGHRQNRTFLPPAEWDPLAPTAPGASPTEVPAGPWEVAVFENRFPTLFGGAEGAPELYVDTRPANGACEVVVFGQEASGSLGTMSLARVELLLDVWADRTAALGARDDVAYVFPFENRGVEVGVTLHHPHGQIYAYPFVPPVAERELAQQRAYYTLHGRGLLERCIESEVTDGRRVLYRGEHAIAFVPVCARWAYEIWVAPVPGAPTFVALTSEERRDFARALKRYADVEAVRARLDHTGEIEAVLRDTWARYGQPMAITEAQLAGAREAQLRWLFSAWKAAERLRSEGADVRAVTAWSLLGAYDWNSLVTKEAGFYESGTFDLRGGSPRPTALARLVKTLATEAPLDEPVLDGLSWWQRPDRLFPTCAGPVALAAGTAQPPAGGRPVLVAGANGSLGRAFSRLCEQRGIACRLVTRHELDVTDESAVERAVERLEPWAIVNAAGYVRVDDAELDRERCFDANAAGPEILARVSARHGVRLLTFSSDLVFDGRKGDPYVESDAVGPMNVYGESKAVGEARVLDRNPDALVVRTAAFFGPWDEANFIARGLDSLEAGKPWVAADDIVVSPTFVVDLVHTCLDLLVDHERGLWHVANDGAVTCAELARRAATLAGAEEGRIHPRPSAALGWLAQRPSYSALASTRGTVLPMLDDALARFLLHRSAPLGVPLRRLRGRPASPLWDS